AEKCRDVQRHRPNPRLRVAPGTAAVFSASWEIYIPATGRPGAHFLGAAFAQGFVRSGGLAQKISKKSGRLCTLEPSMCRARKPRCDPGNARGSRSLAVRASALRARYRLETWTERRALALPYFLRSAPRGSRVRKPPCLSAERRSGSKCVSALEM